ncbi:hypothetical protein [Acaryochloris sp. IP29b_bin.148]|uniref:hypothetical protein n=1 Tax=Acaryochloris sp. IP29b_bin.148 TaxID=2969218 RepID=UPI0026258820|nr:hypothetical protein [Acaryochloris sp. IP29b_bin.148]
MDLDLAMMTVWLFLGLSLGVLGLLMIVTLANTLSAIQPDKTTKRRSFNFGTLLHGWFRRIPLPSSGQKLALQSESESSISAMMSSYFPPLACELEVRSAPLSPNCCLLHTKQGSPLHGGAIATRLTRLRRLGILL